MGREAQKKREEDGTAEQHKDAGQEVQQVDPAAAAFGAMTAFEDRRFLVQTVAVGRKDPSGLRELTFPVTPTKQITLVLAPELQEHILKEFAGGIEVANLADLAAAREQAEQEEKKS